MAICGQFRAVWAELPKKSGREAAYADVRRASAANSCDQPGRDKHPDSRRCRCLLPEHEAPRRVRQGPPAVASSVPVVPPSTQPPSGAFHQGQAAPQTTACTPDPSPITLTSPRQASGASSASGPSFRSRVGKGVGQPEQSSALLSSVLLPGRLRPALCKRMVTQPSLTYLLSCR